MHAPTSALDYSSVFSLPSHVLQGLLATYFRDGVGALVFR
jgi:hypothetical protein